MKEDIEKKFEKLDFVKWDRFVGDKNNTYFYGWINREKDAYKDFLIIILNKQNNKWWYLTSSIGYDEKIDKILEINKIRIPCERIEHHFNINNSIKLNA